MAKSAMTKLEQENEALRKLLFKLGQIVPNTVAGVKVLFDDGNQHIAPPLFESLTPEQVVSALRDASLECGRLARASAESRAIGDFEEIAVELANKAAQLEAMFRIPTRK